MNQNKIRTILASLRSHTANEGPVRIQYKCLVPIYVFLEMKLLFPKQNCNVLSPTFYTHISVRDFYISRIGLPFCCRKICGPILGSYTINHSQTHECGNWDWGRAIPRKGIHKWDFLCSAYPLYVKIIYALLLWLWSVSLIYVHTSSQTHRGPSIYLRVTYIILFHI